MRGSGDGGPPGTALRYASRYFVCALNKSASFVFVSATTNGTHGTGSRHYSGLAVDISRINGKYISSSYPSDASVKAIVDALQDEGDKQTGIRENFGPKFLHKHKKNWTVDAHDDHIHFSVD